MIDLVFSKKNILRYVRDLGAVRGMGRGLSYYQVVLYKVKMEGRRIKRREVVNGARRIRSEKLREH